MAITWGAWEVDANGQGMRVGMDVTWSTPVNLSTSVTATIKVYTENKFRYNDSQTLNYAGDLSGTKTFLNEQGTSTSGGGTVLRDTKSYTYTYLSGSYYTSPGNARFRATISGAFNNVTPTVLVVSAIPARPAGAPSAPTNVTSSPNNGYISVSFGAPTSDGGAPISYYRYSTNGGVTWITIGSNPFNVNGTNGTEIIVDIQAVNAAGIPGAGASTRATPRTTPSAPTSFAGNNATFGQISLSWAAPTSNGGNAVSGYVLRTGTTVLQDSTSTSYTHTGLLPYTNYTYTVTAKNDAGEGTAASLTIRTLGGIVRIYQGTTAGWVVGVPKYYNGSTWVGAQARVNTSDDVWTYGT
jgi:hypothetical protein